MNPDLDLSPEGAASVWWNILDDALRSRQVVAVRLISGDLYTGHAIAVGDSTFTLEAPNPDSGTMYENVIAFTAIIAITHASSEEG